MAVQKRQEGDGESMRRQIDRPIVDVSSSCVPIKDPIVIVFNEESRCCEEVSGDAQDSQWNYHLTESPTIKRYGTKCPIRKSVPFGCHLNILTPWRRDTLTSTIFYSIVLPFLSSTSGHRNNTQLRMTRLSTVNLRTIFAG
ncbi:hypothetical protein TNCV_2501831 [Trichonephila clavipes]|nr:hypothetical protein TNCV_2501831 [Trichonephila clavipes]